MRVTAAQEPQRQRPASSSEPFGHCKNFPPRRLMFGTRGFFSTLAPVIEVIGLTKLYDQFVAVNDLSFVVRPGEVLGLVGPNGAGKTTTLRCLAGIIPPTRGVVRVCGHDMGSDAVAAKRALAFLSDEPRLFDYLT